MKEAEASCLEEAEARFGVVTRAEALGALTVKQLEHRLEDKAWFRVFPRVYRVAGAPQCWRQTLEALSLWAGKGAALSHRTAAALHGFARFTEEPLEVTVTRCRRAPSGVKLHFAALPTKDVAEVQDLSVTSATRTLLDLCAATDLPTMRATIDEALRRKLTTLARLSSAAASSKNRPGVPDLRRLIHEFDGGDGPTESELEALVMELIESVGLPRPRRQRVVRAGNRVRRLDFSFADTRIVIEADGYAHHAGIESFEEDRERRNSLTVQNFKVLHWTWQAMKERPEDLLGELFAVLNTR